MRTLYFSPRNLWPPNAGARIRDYYLTRELATRALVSFVGIYDDRDSSGANPDGCGCDLPLEHYVVVPKGPSYTAWKIVRGFVGPTPLAVMNYTDHRVGKELMRVLDSQDFDVVQIEGIHLMGYLPLIRSRRRPPLVVCDWHDIESELMQRYSVYAPCRARRIYAARTAHLLRAEERRLLTQCDAHLAVSERDRSMLRKMVPDADIHVIENGVDVQRYSRPCLSKQVEDNGHRCRDIVFVGSMDFHANIDAVTYFASTAWPRIHADNPQLRLVIVGSRPVLQVRELANLPGTVVTGTVEDVLPYYREAMAAIVPMRIAGGTRLKILEAMAAAVPVISTSVGAEGLAVSNGLNILIAEKPEEMVRRVKQLGSSGELRRRLCQAGLELVRARYDWSIIGSSLHEIHRALVGRRSRA